MAEQDPLVSIVVVTHKRRDPLAQCLRSVAAQEYANRETIVVDNASNDGLGEFLSANFPDARLVELSTNSGAGGGRNAGIAAARGEIIITLDDDVYLESAFEISKIVKAFETRPDIHVLAIQLCDADTGKLRPREWCHPRSWQEFGQTEFETNYFVEGSCATRREVFEVAGAYYEPFFIGNEGYDLTLRIMDHGFRILYCPQIRLRHMMSTSTRTPDRPYFFYTRNYIWIAYKDFSLFEGLKMLIPKLGMMLYFSIRTSKYKPFLKGLWAGITGLRQIRPDRTPVSPATLRYYNAMEKNRPNLLVRLARHRSAPQL
jgi:GT2 family glycosyltransferase